MQLDLFADSRQTILRNEMSDFLQRLDLERFMVEAARFLAEYPDDQEILTLAATAERWRRHLAAFSASAEGADRLVRLHDALSPADPPLLRKGLRRFLIDELQRQPNPERIYHPPRFHLGLLLLESCDPDAAGQCLDQALATGGVPIGRFLAWRGDALWQLGETGAARKLFLRAFLEDPETIDLEHLRDAELLALIRDPGPEEGELPLAWLPVLGWLAGIFPCETSPVATDPATFSAVLAQAATDGMPPPRLWFERLRYAEYLRLSQPRHSHLVPVRRQLKAGNPLLFERYMARLQGKGEE